MRRIYTLLAIIALGGCGGEVNFNHASAPQVHTYLNYIKDAYGRYVYFHGLNVSGSDKWPVNDDPCFYSENTACTLGYSTNITPTYVGKPFAIQDADRYFRQIKALGFNAIRLIMNWEAIQPESPYKYDTEYLNYIKYIVGKANEYGIYVLMDMHQDAFSRHLLVYYNEGIGGIDQILNSVLPGAGALVNNLIAFIPPYSDGVRGDGAPRWAVEAALPEKDLNSPVWGVPYILGSIADPTFLNAVTRIITALGGENFLPPGFDASSIQGLINTLITGNLPKYPFDITETTNMLPFTNWGISVVLSTDIQRAFAVFLAGKDAFPTQMVYDEKLGRNVHVQDYLQSAYARAWTAVVQMVKDYPNVIGYDIINEPVGFFLTLTLQSAFFELGDTDALKAFLSNLLNLPDYPTLASDFVDVLTGLKILPPQVNEETRRRWGLQYADLMGLLGLNYGFNKNYLQPFYERVAGEILKYDPDGVIWFEPALGLDIILGFLGAGETPFQINMTKLEVEVSGRKIVPMQVYAPHWYADIYPFPGFNQKPREFTPEEVKFRDYKPDIESVTSKTIKSLGNIPVVMGEFGTYFNFNSYPCEGTGRCYVSEEILDNYYEAFENLTLSHFQWCWSGENKFTHGEGWNREDFSIIDPFKRPRGKEAYARTHPTFISGKPISMHFYSYLHYFDPEKGVVNPVGEFELKFESRETDAPTVIYIPYEIYYPDGFYVWLSDGYAVYQHFKSDDPDLYPTYGYLYFYPTADDPGFVHSIKILPPLPGRENVGWQYFFREDTVVSGVLPPYGR